MSLHPRFVDAITYLHPGVDFRKDVLLQDDGAGPYLKTWNLPGLPPTNQECDAAILQIPAADSIAKKESAKMQLDADVSPSRIDRAIASLVLDELNILRAWLVAFKGEVNASTTLADLKTRVAGLQTTGPRTLIQVKTAIKAAIDQEP